MEKKIKRKTLPKRQQRKRKKIARKTRKKEKRKIVSKARIVTPEQAEHIQMYDFIMNSHSTKWHDFDGRQLCRLMSLCIKAKRKDLIAKIRQHIRKRLVNRRLSYNPILGWVTSSETNEKVSGVKRIGRHWKISDPLIFQTYLNYKKGEEQEKYNKQIKMKYKKQIKQNHNKYMDQVLKDDKLPF